MILLLLILGAQRHQLWELSDQPAQVWNICGAVAILALLWIAVYHHYSRVVLGLALWWTAEELMVIGCSGWYMIAPWPIKPGQAQCSALIGFDLSAISIVCIGIILWTTVRLDRYVKSKGRAK